VRYGKTIRYPIRGGRRRVVSANVAVSFMAQQGDIVALVGESGAGKSTVARIVAGLETATAGTVLWQGENLAQHPVTQRTLAQRRAIQMIFQHAHETLNPSWTVGAQIARVYTRYGLARDAQTRQRLVLEILDRVQLQRTLAQSYPYQLSGGQQQRVAIARAFAAQPALVIADEPVAALDVSVQAAVLALLLDMQRVHGTTLLFISHDLGVVRYLADTVVVLYLGQVMERGTVHEVFAPPYHPYTAALLTALPTLAPQPRPTLWDGEVPSALEPPRGCPFVTRCPHKLPGLCETTRPPSQAVTASHMIACHLPLAQCRAVFPAS